MIELTPEQRRAVSAEAGAGPVRAIDPDTRAGYVLVPEAVYDRLKSLLGADDEGGFARDAYADAMNLFGRDGWNDPAMDVYDELDPRRDT